MASKVTISQTNISVTASIAVSRSGGTVTATVTLKTNCESAATGIHGELSVRKSGTSSWKTIYSDTSSSRTDTWTTSVSSNASGTISVDVKLYSNWAYQGSQSDTETISASYSARTFTVTFNANGGNTPSPASKTVTYNSTYGTLATCTRTGYTLKGWYTATSGGTKIETSTKVTITANQTLYAQWTANTYTVTYNANGGTVSPATKTVTYGSSYGTLATPTMSGYKFLGWYTSASGGTQVTSSTTVSITAAQTLYAHWEPMAILHLKQGSTVTDVTQIWVKDGSTIKQVIACYSVENGVVKQGI